MSTKQAALASLVRRFIETRDHQSLAVRDQALHELGLSLQYVVWERLADEPGLDSRYENLDGLKPLAVEVPTPLSVHIIGAFFLLHQHGHLMLPVEGHLTVEPDALSSVQLASLESVFDIPQSERQFVRGIERASWRYRFDLQLA